MGTNKDLQLDTIGVTAQLEGRNLNIGVRTRLTTAIDRLAGNLVDIPNWFLEAWKARKDAANQIDIAVIKAKGDLEVARIKAGDALSIANVADMNDRDVRLLSELLESQERKQNSRIGVLIEATEELKLNAGDSSEQEEAADLDEDWLTMFSDFAERASSVQMQQLWGRILAGEIRKPNTFSRSTLRVISELDRRFAEAYERLLQWRVGDFFLTEGADDYRRDLFMAEELGLIFGSDGTIGLPLSEESDGYCYTFSGKFYLRTKFPERKKFQLPTYIGIARMSRVGQELASIIVAPERTVGLRKLAEVLHEKADHIQLCQVIGENAGSLLEELKGPSKG